MKVLLIAIAVCCVASSHTAMIKKDESEKPYDEACLIDYGILEPDKAKEITYEQAYCVAACMYKKKKIMNSDGTINEEVAGTYFTPGDELEKQIFYDQYNACKDRTHCQLVQCMFETLLSKTESYTSSPEGVSQRLFKANSIFKF